MSVDVFAPTYDSAAAALLGANHDAAALYSTATQALGQTSGMAGDDATSTDFAREYDIQAQATIDALRDLVDASGNLAVLTATSVENHRQGNAAAVYTAPPLLLLHCLIPGGAGEIDVPAYNLGTAEGSDNNDIPDLFNLLIDHVQGIAWPNADTTTLRTAATTWRSTQTQLNNLSDPCQSAINHLDALRSPEIPLAINAVEELRTAAWDLADACGALATACDDYAQQVEEHRELVKDILKSLAIEAGITAGLGVAFSLISFGLSAGGASTAIATRAGAYGTRIAAVLTKLKTAVRVGAIAKLGTVGVKIKKLGPVLQRLATKTARRGKRAPKFPKRTPDEVLKALPKGVSKSGKVRVVHSEADLRRVWDELRDGGKIIEGRGGAKYEGWYRLPDGTEVGLRRTSNSGGLTIDIRKPGSPKQKVHIDD